MAIFSFKESTVGQKIIGSFLLIMASLISLIIFLTVSRMHGKLLVSQGSKSVIVSSNLALACGDPMMAGEWDKLDKMMKEAKKNDTDVKYAILVNSEGKAIAASEDELKDNRLETEFDKRALWVENMTTEKNPAMENVFEVKVPVIAAGGKLGVLRIGYSTESITATIVNTVFVSIIIGFLSLLVGSIIYYFMVQFAIVGPLSEVMGLSQRIAMGDLMQKDLETTSEDEIGELAKSFIEMSGNLRDMVFQVRNSADNVASSSEEMSSSAQEISASTQEVFSAIKQVSKGSIIQAERVEETFEIMEKVAGSLKQVVANAQTTSKAVNLTSERAELGKTTAKGAVEKIEQLTVTITNTTKVIQSLGQMSQQIGEITETITSIADQTNLLALNAAIEAARAGEAGRGFAVVAEEVRKLAEGSADAVRKIGSLIKSIQNETNSAVNAIQTSFKEVQEGKSQIGKIAEVLTEINRAAQEASVLAQQIAGSGQERVIEVERVVKGINEIATIAKESASATQQVTSTTEEQTASMEEMTASAQELARLARQLKETVSKFRLKEGQEG
ncbi:MAG: methyl-accepting chemotaxis protein [bacterium]